MSHSIPENTRIPSPFALISRTRRANSTDREVVIVLNFTPIPRHNYQIGVPAGGYWSEVLNSDAALYGGSGQGNMGGVEAVTIPYQGQRWSLLLTLPPLGAVFLTPESDDT